MIYAQFYQKSATNPDETIPATGDRSVIVLDGRRKLQFLGEVAHEECIRRGYVAWSLHVGEAFTRSKRVSDIHHIRREAIKTYTVIGIWEDDHSRFADSYEARNPWEAEQLAQEECGDNFIVAGVFEGELEAVA